jgi:hypothetical protein
MIMLRCGGGGFSTIAAGGGITMTNAFVVIYLWCGRRCPTTNNTYSNVFIMEIKLYATEI